MIAQPNPQDRILADFRALSRAATPELAALYEYDYIVQSSDGNTVDALPFDRTAGLPPISGVPIRTGIPGAKVTPKPGTRLAIGFLDADYTRFVVSGVYDSSQALEVTFDALAVNLGPTPARQGVVLDQLLALQLTELSVAVQAIQDAIDNITGGPGPLSGTIAQSGLNAAVDAAVLAFNLSLANPNASATVQASE